MPRIPKGGAAPTAAPPGIPADEGFAQSVRDDVYAMKSGDRVEVHGVDGGYVVAPEGTPGWLTEALKEAAPENAAATGPEEPYIPPPPVLTAPDPKRRPVTHIHGRPDALWVSGFCQGEAQAAGGALAGQLEAGSIERMHARCPGAVTSGNGTTTICGCPNHRGEHRCHICGHVSEGGEGFDADRRRCVDIEACADRLHTAAIAAANTPLSRMLREVKAAGARPEAADPTTGVPRPPSARRQGRPCQCGCGIVTGGGLFRPGHDAKLKSTLTKAAATERGAAEELWARHWPLPLGAKAVRDFKDEEERQRYIEQRVADRYAGTSEGGAGQ